MQNRQVFNRAKKQAARREKKIWTGNTDEQLKEKKGFIREIVENGVVISSK
jgi:hypothetical protein